MKVVHLITRLIIGGAQENTLFNVDDQHHLHGDEVTLITGPGLGPEGSLVEKGRNRGLDIRVVPEFQRNIHPLRDWKSWRTIRQMIRELQPDLVHTHSSKAGIVGRAIAAGLRIPSVHTIHGAAFHYGQHPVLFRVYRAAERWAARRCNHIISVADAMTEQYLASGIGSREQYTTIYSGMDVEPFLNPPVPRSVVREQLGFEPQHIVIGKIARLFHLKGHEFVIQAAAKVVEQQPNVRFLFVGDGILREQYELELATAGLRDHFVFTGLVPPARIPELIHAMDIVVHTSLWEGLARVLPQGLMSAKPVVSYDVDGAREVIINGETGFLLPPQSVHELADALLTLVGDADLREQFGQTGRARFTDQFRHQFMTERIRAVYQRVLDETRSESVGRIS